MPIPLSVTTATSSYNASGNAIRAPRIAYDNLLASSEATISVTSEDADFPKEYAYDGLEYTHWMPTSAGTNDLTATFTVAKPVNYFAGYATDLAANAGTIQLQYSTDGGATFSNASTARAPGDTSPWYESFSSISAAIWRVRVISTPASKIGMVAFGTDFQCEHGHVVGFMPPLLARDNEIRNNTSERGIALGRTLIRQGSRCTLDLAHHSPTFVRNTWLPFMRSAELKPFFLIWNPTDYPTEAAVCWTEGQPGKPSYSKTTKMSMSLDFRAKVE